MSTLSALFSCPLFPDLTRVSSIIKAGDFNHYATVPRQRRKKSHVYFKTQTNVQRFKGQILLAFGGIWYILDLEWF